MNTRWIITIGGFLQGRGEQTGIYNLWKKLTENADNGHCIVPPPYCWDDDMSGLANTIYRYSGESSRVLICAYSYGAGYAAPKLVRALKNRGIYYIRAVLSDPVSRWWVLKPLSLIRHDVKIDLTPDGEMKFFTQHRSRPGGNTVNGAKGIGAAANHIWMDEHRPFHELCVRAGAAENFSWSGTY